MKHIFAALLLLTAGLFADEELAPAQECRPRAGLPNFFEKAGKPGAELRVAYLGGSITAQPGWRVKSLAHFQKQFPAAKFTEINAAIGGTGSDLGVFRVGQDVLEKKPDLLFVEFAVNDGGAAPEQIHRCMEGIVRQTWRALPECDVCFVYTLSEPFAGPLMDGKFQRSASAMEKVAGHYGIPTIHMGVEVGRLAKEGRLLWKAPLPKTDADKTAIGDKVVFAPDGVHPHVETGHALYMEAIARSLPAIQSAGQKPSAHTLGAPFIASNFERAKLVPINEATLSDGITRLDAASDVMAKRFPQLRALHHGTKPGESITFRFKGTRAALYDLVGPDCGQVVVTLDNMPPKTIPRFDAYCTYHRLSTFTIGSDLPDTEHTVKIEIHPDQPDKAKILAQRNEKIDKPERFEGTAIYPGSILMLGELVK